MFNLSFFRIAVKSLLLNKIRSFLTMLGVIIGVAAVIILTSIVSGLEQSITTQFESFGSNTLFIFPGQPGGGNGPGGAVVNKLEYRDRDSIAKVSGVSEVSIQVFNSATANYRNKEVKGVILNGVEANYADINGLSMTQGRFLTPTEVRGAKNVAVIGPTIVDKLFGNENPLGKEIKVKDKRFKVIGVKEAQGAIFGSDQDIDIYIPYTISQRSFDIDRPNVFYVKVAEGEDIKQVQKRLEVLMEKLVSKDDFSVYSQEQSLDFISNILGILATALGGIAAISLLVGGVGIMNIMFVSVSERTREIGLRKAVGANSKIILTQFLIEAIILSFLGGLIGVLTGIAFSLLLGNFIDIKINIMYVGLSFVVSAIVGIVFGVAPAVKASRLDPIVALKYE